MNALQARQFALILALLSGARFSAAAEDVGGLLRAGFFGAAISPLDDDVRRERKLDPGVGVLVRMVTPGSAAEEAGLKPDDIIKAVDGVTIDSPSRFVAQLGRRKAGAKAKVVFAHGGEEQSKEVTLKPRPRESGTDEYDVLYDSVASRGGRLRTIVTRPKGPGRHPALLVIQGLGSFSIENAPGNPSFYRAIIDDFGHRGYVTVRVDKPGQGDSEGGPTQDVDFETELDGYRQSLKALTGYDFVDKSRVLIFGHSMGGIMGPPIAAEEPGSVRGIATYGTAAKTWYEYLLENTRRQMALGGASAAEIDDALRKDSAINYEVFVEGKPPGDVAKARPELSGRVGELFSGGKYYAGRHYEFFKQLSWKNLPAAWAKFGGHALAIWGRSDFVTCGEDHALIADVVNKAHTGYGTYVALEGIDHGFNRAGSPEESFQKKGQPGEFNPVIVTTLADWSEKVNGPTKPNR
jgi:pimeloyl-ACP methyl ester carboxylesterase